jgi:hypothetical protein
MRPSPANFPAEKSRAPLTAMKLPQHASDPINIFSRRMVSTVLPRSQKITIDFQRSPLNSSKLPPGHSEVGMDAPASTKKTNTSLIGGVVTESAPPLKIRSSRYRTMAIPDDTRARRRGCRNGRYTWGLM